MKKVLIFLLISLVLGAAELRKDPTPHYPKYFPIPVYNFSQNPLDENVIQLGRALFYDAILSRDNTISCSSCHSSYAAFAHVDHNLSHGIEDRIGTRNAPALMNLAWQSSFMWDGAINHLDMQALAPISHPKEMDEDIAHVVAKLSQSALYEKLFSQAFGDDEITGQRVLKSLSQFQLTLVSSNSKYDQVKQKKAHFTEQEEKGYQLFKTHCDQCHREPLFSDYEFKNNGLSVDPSLNDLGKMMISKNSSDSLLFKTPTLRNIEYTYPYMHDGRFKKIADVLHHYTNGIEHSRTLSKELEKDIVLSSNDKVDLTAFLLTLSDSSFVFNENYAFPKTIFNSKEGKK